MVFTILSSPSCCEQYLLIDEVMAHQPTHQFENNYFGTFGVCMLYLVYSDQSSLQGVEKTCVGTIYRETMNKYIGQRSGYYDVVGGT